MSSLMIYIVIILYIGGSINNVSSQNNTFIVNLYYA